jgi:hypothetical protein
MDLVKATLTNLGSLESHDVLWNPESYTLSRRRRLATVRALGATRASVQAAAGGEEEFATELLLDGTRRPAGERDLRPLAAALESWMDPPSRSEPPPRVLFAWGSFRFRGYLVALEETWVLFDPDGAPVRGWLQLLLRS